VTRALSPEVTANVVARSSLEWKLTSPLAFGLTTASDLQRAICRVADGKHLEELAKCQTVKAAFGDVAALPPGRCRELYVMSGIRTGKSLIAACAAFHMAMTCDVSSLRPGEVPRVSVVSLKKDLADVILNHLVGSIQASKLLSSFLIGDPSGDGIMLRHPSGMPVEVSVVAGSRAGSSLVARWSAGVVFDEFPRMIGGDEGVVNFDDMRQAVIGRLLKGCMLWGIGSPWAPFGPAYEMFNQHWGKPTDKRIVVKAPAPAMNPVYWTPERVAQIRAQDANAAKTDVDAEFASPEEALFSAESIRRCTRTEPVVPFSEGNTYMAAMDPATRGNGWTLAIATRERGKVVICRAVEWMGARDAPLDPKAVLEEAAQILGDYRLTTVHSDQYFGDALIALGRDVGLNIVQWRFVERERAERYLTIRARMDREELELPPVPTLRTDLLHIRKRVTPTGMGVTLPLTSDGRHCDWGPTLMLVASKLYADPDPPTRQTTDPETLRMRQFMLEKFKRKDSW
jgi:hypothetical protein